MCVCPCVPLSMQNMCTMHDALTGDSQSSRPPPLRGVQPLQQVGKGIRASTTCWCYPTMMEASC